MAPLGGTPVGGTPRRAYATSLKSFLIVYLLFVSLCSSFNYAEYVKSSNYITDALRTLKNVKKRLINSERSSISKRRSRRHKLCRGLYDRCVAWNGRSDQKCCERSQVCTCNIFFQNCRCERRVFNWHSWW